MSQKLEAKVKDTYNMGPIVAFSGHEYIRTEWRPVPAGSEPAALVHPLLDVREVGGEEIPVTAKDHLADTLGTADLKAAAGEGAVTVETPEEPGEEEETKPAKRTRKSSKKEE